MNYIQLSQAIQNYAENNESLFVASIPTFIMEAEERIYNTVQIPTLRKNVTGSMTIGNKYVSLPADWLANYSVAVIGADGTYSYLLNKDVNYMREAYPNPSVTGIPKYYALFGSQLTNIESLSLILAPTPDTAYGVELHYFYYPVSIVQGVITGFNTIVAGTGYNTGTYNNVPLSGGSGTYATATIVVASGGVTSVTINDGGSLYVTGNVLSTSNTYLGGAGGGFTVTVSSIANPTGTSWLGDNYDPVLFYGAMREAIIFMKGEADMVSYYEKMYMEAVAQLNRLGTGLERGDTYRDHQAKIKVSP
jgi:hypothetical protein